MGIGPDLMIEYVEIWQLIVTKSCPDLNKYKDTMLANQPANNKEGN